jgi:hypothetical protein
MCHAVDLHWAPCVRIRRRFREKSLKKAAGDSKLLSHRPLLRKLVELRGIEPSTLRLPERKKGDQYACLGRLLCRVLHRESGNYSAAAQRGTIGSAE